MNIKFVQFIKREKNEDGGNVKAGRGRLWFIGVERNQLFSTHKLFLINKLQHTEIDRTVTGVRTVHAKTQGRGMIKKTTGRILLWYDMATGNLPTTIVFIVFVFCMFSNIPQYIYIRATACSSKLNKNEIFCWVSILIPIPPLLKTTSLPTDAFPDSFPPRPAPYYY